MTSRDTKLPAYSVNDTRIHWPHNPGSADVLKLGVLLTDVSALPYTDITLDGNTLQTTLTLVDTLLWTDIDVALTVDVPAAGRIVLLAGLAEQRPTVHGLVISDLFLTRELQAPTAFRATLSTILERHNTAGNIATLPGNMDWLINN